MAERKHGSHARQRRGGSPYRIYLVGAVIAMAAVVVVIAMGAAVRGGSDGGNVGGPVVVPTPRPASVAQDGRVLGDPTATVRVVEYLDFQCPICKRLGLEVMPEIEAAYVETGTAKLEIRPIAILGDESVQAAAAAECANEQGQFWRYHDTLFANQGKKERAGAFADDRLKEMAAAIGLDTGAFNACLDSGKYVGEVERVTDEALGSGVRGTPTILVDGVQVENSVDGIAAAIEQAAGS